MWVGELKSPTDRQLWGVEQLFGFIVSAVAISLSGVMAPGPITAATLAAGSRSRHAGAVIGLGHIIVELPLILLLVAGMGTLFESPGVQMGIGLAGGVVLVLMGLQLLFSLPATQLDSQDAGGRHPLLTGMRAHRRQPLLHRLVGHCGSGTHDTLTAIRTAGPGPVCARALDV